MAEEIKRIIEVDTASSVQTIRELQEEVEKLRGKLSQLSEGSEQYAATQERAAQAEQQLNQAMEITEDSAATRAATTRQLAETEAREAAEVAKLVEALVEYRDAGYDTSASLQGVSHATQQATHVTAQLTDSVLRLQDSASELIASLVEDQQELAEVRAQRKELTAAIKEGTVSEEVAREVKGELIAQEAVYKTRIAQTQQELKTATKTVQAAEGSYAQMSQTLSRLQGEYRQLSAQERTSARGTELLTKIQGLSGELKALDASMGNYQRNVGNYQSALDKLIPSFSGLTSTIQGLSNGTMSFTGVAKGAIGALRGMTSAAMAFLATPLGLVLAALVVAYKAIKSSIDEVNAAIEGNVELSQLQEREQAKVSAWQAASQVANEQSARTWIKVKGAISETWEVVKLFYRDAFSLNWKHFWNTITNVKEIRAASLEVADLKKQLHELQVGDPDTGRLGNIEKAAKLEGEIATLRQKAMDQENYSDEEREQALRDAVAKNKELYAMKRQELDLELRIAEAQHKASPDDAAFQQQWARLRAQRDQLRGQEANAERMLTRSLNKFTVDDTEAAAKKAGEKREKAAKATADATERITRDTLKLQQEARAKTEENEIKTARENYDRDLADFERTVKEKGISEEVAAAYRTAIEEKTQADIANIRHKYLVQAWEEEQKETERQEKIAEQAKKETEKSVKADYASADSDLERGAAMETAIAKRDISDPQKLEEELSNIQQRLYEKRVELIDETLQGLDQNSALYTELSNKRTDLEIKNIERIADAERKAAEEKKKRNKLVQEQALQAASTTLNSLSSILGEESKAGKAAAVAAATIDTYKAANAAYASLAEVPIVGPALGAAAAAAAVIAGIANVKKILSTKADGSNASAASPSSAAVPAVVTPPAVVQQVPVTRSLTSATEEERLNQAAEPQKVVLVYSEVEAAGRHVDVVQSESTF